MPRSLLSHSETVFTRNSLNAWLGAILPSYIINFPRWRQGRFLLLSVFPALNDTSHMWHLFPFPMLTFYLIPSRHSSLGDPRHLAPREFRRLPQTIWLEPSAPYRVFKWYTMFQQPRSGFGSRYGLGEGVSDLPPLLQRIHN